MTNRLGRALALVFLLSTGVTSPGLAQELTLERVLFSTGGVGYLEYGAQVEGNAELELVVPLDQVDDVLKSIVVFDSAGGVGQVRLPGREPLAQVFRDLPFGPGALESPSALLNHLQGAEITTQGSRDLAGRVLRVAPETVVLPEGQGTTTQHRVTLVTDSGLQQFVLEQAEAVQFADPVLREQVAGALDALADHRVQDKRRLTIQAQGEGTRQIKVGYVVAMPLWKASYRVSLASPGESDSVALQGWAHIDNLSGQDWDEVALTLVSGNPVTFRQALYSAFFVDRPEVPVEVLGRILPRLDQGALSATAELRERAAAAPQAQFAAKAEMDLEEAPAVAMAPAPPAEGSFGDSARQALLAASAREAATQVVFALPGRVSVGNGQALMVPIVERLVPGTRLALYQPGTHGRHPLAAVELENDGASGLPPGSLTLYEAGPEGAASYLGDARLANLPAGETRLVSFALDQKTTIDREDKRQQQIAKGRINRGVLELTYSERLTTLYRIKAPATEGRRLLIEHPRRPGWELVAPPAEEVEVSEQDYRIAAEIDAGTEALLQVTLERPRLQAIRLANLSGAQLAAYAENGELDPKLRAAIAEIGTLRGHIEQLDRRLGQLNQERDRIFQEQKRIRDNLSRIPKDSDLYRRYITKLDEQEDQLEEINRDFQETQAARDKAEDELIDQVGQLTL
ncbi:MAG: DUF4139 domain-containing protein [Pseudomonadota bacterium]